MGRFVLLLVLYLAALYSAVDSFGAEKPVMPSFELSRHFSGGGYEQLKLACHEDRTRSEAAVCDLRRFRNGMEVASVVVDYKWTRDQLGKFFRGTASKSDSGASGGQVVLTYDAHSDGERRQGTIHREDKSDQLDRVKALMAIEGSLVGEFYR